MKVLLTRSRKPFSYLIRLFTWSRFSHTATLMEDTNTVIDSTLKYGVKEWSMNDFMEQHDLVVMVEMNGDYKQARRYIGQGYDWRGIFGILIRNRSLNADDDLFCSELSAILSGCFRQERVGSITPEEIFKCSTGYKVLKNRFKGK